MTKGMLENKFESWPMKMALCNAEKAESLGEIPVGVVVVSAEKRIIASTYNEVEKMQDPTAHAEIIAIRDACLFLGTKNLSDCSLYVTLEPCAMCATAISYARIKEIYYAAPDKKFGAIEHGPRIFNSNSALFIPEIYSGIYSTESSTILKKFFLDRRFKS